MMAEPVHLPVLAAEVVEHLAPRPGARLLDCTCGLGGHSLELLQCGAAVLGIDRDGQARRQAAARLADFGSRFQLRPGDFAGVAAELVAEGQRFDGLLADLGVSSLQLDEDARGFSIRSTADADMRMGDGCDQDAVELIAATPTAELAGILKRFGEVAYAGRISRGLQEAVAAGERSGAALAAAVRRMVPGSHRRHPAVPVFQALRMAVNDELGQLTRLLQYLPALLAPGGRAVLISFHSLEDRLVKQAFRHYHQDGSFAAISRKVVLPGDEELARNPRAHSAKLRWAISAAPSTEEEA